MGNPGGRRQRLRLPFELAIRPARAVDGHYVGFLVIGGEWFSMWQSPVWNGQQKAAMFLGCAMLVLIVLLLPEE